MGQPRLASSLASLRLALCPDKGQGDTQRDLHPRTTASFSAVLRSLVANKGMSHAFGAQWGLYFDIGLPCRRSYKFAKCTHGARKYSFRFGLVGADAHPQNSTPACIGFAHGQEDTCRGSVWRKYRVCKLASRCLDLSEEKSASHNPWAWLIVLL